VRPAVCLTEPARSYRHLALITGQGLAHLLRADVVLDWRQADPCSTGPRASSTSHLHRLTAAPPSIVLGELGELSPGMRAAVGAALRKVFQLG